MFTPANGRPAAWATAVCCSLVCDSNHGYKPATSSILGFAPHEGVRMGERCPQTVVEDIEHRRQLLGGYLHGYVTTAARNDARRPQPDWQERLLAVLTDNPGGDRKRS